MLTGIVSRQIIWCANRDSLARDRYDALTGTVSREIDMVCLQRQSRGTGDIDGVLTGTVSREIDMVR